MEGAVTTLIKKAFKTTQPSTHMNVCVNSPVRGTGYTERPGVIGNCFKGLLANQIVLALYCSSNA